MMSKSLSKKLVPNLLRAINSGELLGEAGWLSGIANSLKDKPSATEEPSVKPPEDVSPDIPHLQKISSQVISVPSGQVRVVIHLSLQDLVTHYLKIGGGKAVIEGMEEAEIRELCLNPMSGQSKIVQMPDKFNFSQQLKSKEGIVQDTVLLNIPKTLIASLVALKDDAFSLEKAKVILSKMMNHTYYIMSINNVKGEKIAAAVDANAEEFNPYVIENYPIRGELVSAKNEWDINHGFNPKTGKQTVDKSSIENDNSKKPEDDSALNFSSDQLE